MREIKFRGKRKGDGEWMYGDLIKSVTKAYIITLVDDTGMWAKAEPRLLYAEVDPATVGQFTGLTGMSGQEIYKGDILKEDCPRGNKYQVMAVPGGFAINMFQDGLKKPYFVESLADMQNNSYVQGSCEVIGNIHEHPHLLEA